MPSGLPSSRRHVLVNLERAGLIVLIVVVWQYVSQGFHLAFFISKPSDVALYIWQLTITGQLVPNVLVTLYEAIVGLVTGAGLGIGVGFLFGLHERLAELFNPIINALNSLPRIALAPLFILWFGLGTNSKVMTAFSLVFFIMLISTYDGIRSVDPALVDMAKLLGASESKLTRYVILPSITSWVFSGFRLAVPYALIGAVAGEFVEANVGLGYLIAVSSDVLNTAGIFGGLLVLALVSMAFIGSFDLIEKKILRWRPVRE